jgi:hypothetical protein
MRKAKSEKARSENISIRLTGKSSKPQYPESAG